MKIDPPPPDAGEQAWHEYAVRVHECVEQGRIDNKAGFKRLRLDGTVNVIALGSLAIVMGGILVAAVRWTDRVDAKLDLIPEMAVQLKNHDARLTGIDAKLVDLQLRLERPSRPPRK